jgi:GR25 family glycosyltransferase involved in LPS biosynthesis
MSGIDVVTLPSYCINLDKRTDRWAKFSQQPGVAEMKLLKRYSAVDGSKINIFDNDQISTKTVYNILNKTRRSHMEIDAVGAIGCTMSHVGVWREFLQTSSPYCVVFEDDVIVPNNFKEIIMRASHTLHDLKDEFHVWLIHYGIFFNNKYVPVQDQWVTPTKFYGTGCYILSRKGAEKLLQHVYPIEMHIDAYIQTKANIGEILLLINKKVYIPLRNSKSNIQHGKCELCNIPDKVEQNNLRIVNKYYLYGIVAYAAVISGYLFYKYK